MLGRMMVEYAAPTLCGLKPASLFAPKMDEDRLRREMHALEMEWAAHGLRLHRVQTGNGTLVLVQRPQMIAQMLESPDEADFLWGRGYPVEDVERAVDTLVARMEAGGEFPHEVGLFLGYPLADVEGFIAHEGRDSLAQGAWKVYADVEAARRAFESFERSTAECKERFENGVRLGDLAVKSVPTNRGFYGMM